MEDGIELSIIVPVYNCEKYVERCLRSICKQTFSNFEVVVVNDGSLDNSLEKCNEIAKEDQRIRVFSIENHGAAYARNYGLQMAQGKYIGFVDADDYIADSMYSVLMESANKSDADVVSCDIIWFYDDATEQRHTNSLRGGYYSREDIVSQLFPILICSPRLEIETPFTMVLKVFKNEFLKKNDIRFEDSLLAGQDFVFATTAFYYARSFVYLKEQYLYYYYQNHSSRTHRYLPNAWQNYRLTNEYWKRLTTDCEEYDFSVQVELDRLHGLMMSMNYMFKPGSPLSAKKTIFEAVELMKNEIHPSVFSNIQFRALQKKQYISCKLLQARQYRLFAWLLCVYYKIKR